MEKGGECLQLLFLIEIDVQLFIVQPFIGIDADIAVSVGVDDEGVGGVFVSVGFEDFLPTVIGWVTTAGEVGNGSLHSSKPLPSGRLTSSSIKSNSR